MAPYIVLAIIIIGKYIGFYFLFKKAGYPAWAGLIPFYNYYIWTKVTGRPWWYAIVSYLPIFGTFVSLSMCIDTAKSFNKKSFLEHVASILIPFIYFPYIGTKKDVEYIGQGATFEKERKPVQREWADAIIFAVVAATIIRWSTFEAFMIPTSSLEGTLLAGDYLFVSKMHYGPRTPKTLLQMPLTHRYFWGTADASGQGGVPSYSEAIQLKTYRLPGLTKVKRDDIVVFNNPQEREYPVDLRTNYVKRCVALPGDQFEIKDAQIHIDGKAVENPKELQYLYFISLKGNTSIKQEKYSGIEVNNLLLDGIHLATAQTFLADNHRTIISEYSKRQLNFEKVFFDNGITEVSIGGFFKAGIVMHTSPAKAEKIRSLNIPIIDEIKSLKEIGISGGDIFGLKSWERNNFGPLQIPYKGMEITINQENLKIYGDLITYDDGNDPNDVSISNDFKLRIKGEEITTYTVNQDYYFMMGDNRDNSEDSRYWGFVPEDHIVGTPMLVWFSQELRSVEGWFERIRWNRVMKYVRNK